MCSEISRRHLLNGLSDNSGSEPVATTDLKHMRETVEHLRNEFVARHHERKPLGIVEIGPARHEAHALMPAPTNFSDEFSILSFAVTLIAVIHSPILKYLRRAEPPHCGM